MVGNDVAVLGEFLFADTANAILGNDLPVEQLAHLPVGAQLAVSAGMLGIVDSPDTQLMLTFFFRDCLPPATAEGAMDRTKLIATESHGILMAGRKGFDALGNFGIVGKGKNGTGRLRDPLAGGRSSGRSRDGRTALSEHVITGADDLAL